MTSGVFQSVDIAFIHIAEDRQRRDLGDLQDLAASIHRNGLINPIVVTRDLQLIAGERRLAASKLAGMTAISVQYAEDLPHEELEILELEENVKRLDLSWQEHNSAVVRYHNLKLEQDPEWNANKSADALGITAATLYRHITVAKEIEVAPQIAESAGFATALNTTKRRQERRRADTLASIDPVDAEEEEEAPARPVELLNVDFLEWVETYSGPKFNFIHFDPPYGINYDKMPGQHTVHDAPVYEDSAETYFKLLGGLLHAESIFADQCHMMLWFAMDHFQETVSSLQETGWRIDKRPLIWVHSDNAGLLPDPNRGPRWVYDTALMCTRGDRKVVQAVANAFSSPTTREFHSSEKPLAVLDHFFRMFVDETSRVLDPTAGSAMAVRAAEARGARYSLGLEILPTNYDNAKRNLGLGGTVDAIEVNV